MHPLRIGVIGCGNISGIYLKNLARFPLARVVACADLVPEKAEQVAAEYGIPTVLRPDDLIRHSDVDLILNLTVPKAHAEVSLAAVQSGKHVYSEKPLAVTRSEAAELLEQARRNGVRIGCAPDTFLGGSHQTCRDIIDEGLIGEPVGAVAFMLCHGHETWHPSPEFYYEVGGGPMLDMGPYYMTALVNLLGPIRTVTGEVRITFPERVITSQPKAGKVIRVETPTHITGIVRFESEAIASITTSFDVWHTVLPRIEIWGTEGSLLVPDPNGFGGQVLIRGKGQSQWEEVTVRRGFTSNSRGLGVADMTAGILSDRPHRASGDLALHVLDAMEGFSDAAVAQRHHMLTCPAVRPESLPPSLFTETENAWLLNEEM